MNLTDLDLCEPVLSVALELSARFPSVVFTSGRRSLESQAAAMEANCRLNPKWIVQTYVASPVSVACQAAVDAGLPILPVLEGLTNDELAHLTLHIVGRAFDVQPDDDDEVDAWLAAKARELGGKYLTREGGIRKRHFQV